MLIGSLETTLSISTMCEALGVKERTLFLACVEAFGRPPKALLLELRLNAVRRALIHPADDQTVTAAASSFGFWHLGEFSAEYKRQFGELPSSTLAKAFGANLLPVLKLR
jgi:AraC family ethanolamine operon transcriptional activator